MYGDEIGFHLIGSFFVNIIAVSGHETRYCINTFPKIAMKQKSKIFAKRYIFSAMTTIPFEKG
jgi:hypothetical protein